MNLNPFWKTALPLLLSGIGIGTLISTTAVSINEYLRRRLDRQKQKADRQRWYAEFFMGPRLEALRALHASLTNCHYSLNEHAGQNVPTTMTDEHFRQAVKAPEKELFNALMLAQIHLNEHESKIMFEALGAVRQVVSSIEYRMPRMSHTAPPKGYAEQFTPVEWVSFVATYETALSCLRKLLNPDNALTAIRDV